MSYRTEVEGFQIFGNNESYKEWIEFIRSEGIEVDEEGYYEGNITNVMGAIKALEAIVLRLAEEREASNERMIKMGMTTNRRGYPWRGLFDLTNIITEVKNADKDDKYETSLLDRLIDASENGYMFLPLTFINACGDKLEPDHVFSTYQHFHCYKIKEGEVIHTKAC